MKELSKEELLEWLEEVKNLFIRADIWSDRSEKIYQQIRQLIESQPSKEMPNDFSKEKDPLVIEGKSPSITLHYPPKDYHKPNKKNLLTKRKEKEMSKRTLSIGIKDFWLSSDDFPDDEIGRIMIDIAWCDSSHCRNKEAYLGLLRGTAKEIYQRLRKGG